MVVLFFMTLFALLIGNKYLGEDFGVVLRWWAGILALGVAFFPLSHAVFNKFGDGGYMVSKALGIEGVAWFIWTLSTMKIMKFTHVNAWVCIFICAVLNYGLYAFYCIRKGNRPFETLNSGKIVRSLYYEVLFLFAFIIFCYIRSFLPTITNDTEKYMDFGFLVSIMNGEYMPPRDMWYAGESINYYYFGIYVGGFLGKVADVTAGYAYNLDLMTICSLGFVQAYALVAELVKLGVAEFDKRRKAQDPKAEDTRPALATFCSHLGGMLAGFAVFIAGNMHYVLYAVIYPFMKDHMGFNIMNIPTYWFPNSTRFISDGDASGGTLIHEFPAYSFILGDLHAHVTDITNVFLIISVLLGFLMNRSERMRAAREEGITEKTSVRYLIKEALNPSILIASFLIGIIRMTNSWDFPIYFVVSGAILCFSNAVITGFKKDTLILTAVHAVECIVISTIVSLPFTLFFDSMTAGINLCYYHSSPYELAVLWALPISVSVGLYVIAIRRYKQEADLQKLGESKKGKIKKSTDTEVGFIRKEIVKEQSSNGTVYKEKGNINHLYSFINRLQVSDLYVLTLAACATGLILMCELIYVKDIYGGSYARSNTMFKLAYQSFMLFGVIMAYGITRLIFFKETSKQRILSIVALVFLVWTFFYFGNGVKGFMGDISNYRKTGRTLDSYKSIVEGETGTGYLNGVYSSEGPERTAVLNDMIKWVLENTEPDAVIAQMPSTAYKPFATLAAFTGRPTIIGWSNHEWLWRNGGTLEYPIENTNRLNAVANLYTTDDEALARRIIDDFGIDYIYVGYTETMVGTVFEEEGSRTDASADYQYYRGTWYVPQNINHEMLKSLGDVVYDAGTCHYTIYPATMNSESKWVADLSREPIYDKEFQAYIVKIRK